MDEEIDQSAGGTGGEEDVGPEPVVVSAGVSTWQLY